MQTVVEQIGRIGLLPIITIDKADHAQAVAQALLASDLACAEVTFRTPAAAAAIGRIATTVPELLLGAGTILTVEQAQTAVDAGAKFLVAPGFDPDVVAWCLKHDVPIFPGVMTPSDISLALKFGLTTLKFFPAEAAGGVPALKAIGGPFVGVNFVPTGGVSAQNLADYLRLPMVVACGGSWMVKRELIAQEKFDTIGQLAREALTLVAQSRGRANE